MADESGKEAILYEKLEGEKVKCGLCAHRCTIKEGRRGKCGVRENRGGTLMSLVYGKLISANVDPIEKKPLFHYNPGSRSFSIATAGCNFRCLHCQNYDISQWPHDRAGVHLPGEEATPEGVVEAALNTGSKSISYTYTEPTIAMEFYLETARLARERGLGNVFVSNGYMTPESAGMMAEVLDANNIDLKGDEKFYKDICGAHLEPVKETIRIMKEAGVWVEVTTLVIPGHNDSDEVLRTIAEFIASVDPFIPWHVTRFYPTYKLTTSPPTPIDSLERARQTGKDCGLMYVYEGNVPGEGGENTYCHNCGELLIERIGFTIRTNRMQEGGRCPSCDTTQKGKW
jgi:pyruvate formate lyase activating enzyme